LPEKSTDNFQRYFNGPNQRKFLFESNLPISGNQSIKDPTPPPPALPAFDPKQMQPIPDSMPADVKVFLQKFPSILRTGNVKPTPTHGVEHHIFILLFNKLSCFKAVTVKTCNLLAASNVNRLKLS
jgi:hypothetical protein